MESDKDDIFKNVQLIIYALIVAVISTMVTSAYIKTHEEIIRVTVVEKPELIKTGEGIFGESFESQVRVSLEDQTGKTYYFRGEDAKKAASFLNADDTISVPANYDQLIFYDDFISFAIGTKLPVIMIIAYTVLFFILFKSIQIIRRRLDKENVQEE